MLNLHKDVKSALGNALDKLDAKPFSDRSGDIVLRLNKSLMPNLFNPNSMDEDLVIWKQINRLGEAWSIERKRKVRALENDWEHVSLRIKDSNEEFIRRLLNRPVKKSYLAEWRDYLVESEQHFKSIEPFWNTPIKIQGKSCQEVFKQLKLVTRELDKYEQLTARQLSSLVFWGCSKFFDNKEESLRKAFGVSNTKIISRPIIINAYLSEKKSANKILFIENFDTYLHLITRKNVFFEDYHLVYSQGFMSSAARIRDNEKCFIHFDGCLNSEVVEHFKRFWFHDNGSLKAYFWGDLDYSGYNIFYALKKVFVKIELQKDLYDKMHMMANSGLGHKPDMAKKENQIIGNNIEKLDYFLDQESLIF
jgi:hypothetical protein